MNIYVTVVLLAITSAALLYAVIALALRLRKLRARYGVIADADEESKRVRAEAVRAAESITAAATKELSELRSQVQVEASRRDGLAADAANIVRNHERLRSELALLEENLEDISFGIYKPHFDFDTPEKFKQAIERVVEAQRFMVRSGTAASCAVEWSVGGSRRDGERMQKQYGKLLLRAFNGECEAAIAKVSWNNATKMEERIRKAFDAINELGGVMQVSIGAEYMRLKLDELQLEFELEERKQQITEDQRRAREQLRDQEKAQRELESEKSKAEDEEDRSAKALNKARVEMAKSLGVEHERMTARVLELEAELRTAQQKKARVNALAELTRAGYVYFISNIGSFGESVFKIGLTRRLDPADRIKELSDASVPFGFDVHAMVYSEDAPGLEGAFHKRFADRCINPINCRKEFFKVSIDELQQFADERNLKIAFTKVPEAREWREAMSRRAASSPTKAPLVA